MAEPTVRTSADPDAYVADVLAGRVIVGELVRLAVERHARELERSADPAFPFVFDRAAVDRRLALCPLLQHVKGELAGQPFVPEPWQCFVIGSTHGWRRRADGRRRFTTVYMQVAKKNGKTFVGAGEGLHGLGFDGEDGAEVYSIATKEEQAKLSWQPAKTIVERSAELREVFGTSTKTIYDEETASFWRPLGSDSKKQDGMNPSTLLVDELHAHPNGDLYNNMQMSMAARRQPLTFIMTTAGAGRTSFCYSIRVQCEKVLRGVVQDDTTFAFIAEPDPGDDWRTETAWRKANPNLGVSVKLDFLREQCEAAQRNPRKENDFRRYHCDQWVEQAVRWIPMHRWDACSTVPAWDFEAQVAWHGDALERLAGRRGRGGLDLARTIDLCAAVMLFPPGAPGEKWTVVPHFWLPEARLENGEADGVPYAVWQRAGLLTVHDGNAIDDTYIEEFVAGWDARYAIEEWAYDPACGGTSLAIRLANRGLSMIEFAQTWKNISPAAKQLEALVERGLLEHGAHPILRWNAANVCARTDANDNIRPAKDKSTGRIDGIAALLNALGRAIHAEEAEISVYESRGLRVIG